MNAAVKAPFSHLMKLDELILNAAANTEHENAYVNISANLAANAQKSIENLQSQLQLFMELALVNDDTL